MPLTKQLSMVAPHHDMPDAGLVDDMAKGLAKRVIQKLSYALPISIKTRNILALLFLLAVIASFWQPLVLLYSLTQEQEHYSHIVLIPFVSLYILYLERKVVLASNEWSPVLGGMLLGAAIMVVLACRYCGLSGGLLADDHLSPGVFVLGNIYYMLRDQGISAGFIWPAVSPFYGPISVCLA